MKLLRHLPPLSKGVTLVGIAIFNEMKEVIEQEKVVVPPTRMCAIPPLPVSREPKVDEPAAMAPPWYLHRG